MAQRREAIEDRLELLLDTEDGRPVLDAGLSAEAVHRAPSPRRLDLRWRAQDRDPNLLPAQRWGVMIPKGPEGKRLLDAIAPLQRLREEEQGAPARVYEVDPGMSRDLAARWREDVYGADEVPEEERPGYLLILGDLDQISIELQRTMTSGAFVGRLCCADVAGYAAYAEKVARWARQPAPIDRPDGLFFTVQDKTSATTEGERLLMRPGFDLVPRWKVPVGGPTAIPYEGPNTNSFLAAMARESPAVLLSLSHGAGPPAAGWTSDGEQRARQGAMSFGKGVRLEADMVRSVPFLRGGVWFFVACFGAGTPAESVYHPWLARLAESGLVPRSVADSVLGSLPRAGARPFVAALPQAVLANPEGPLAVIGHLDLAWTYAFASSADLGESRASRILTAWKSLAAGVRAGAALDLLLETSRHTDARLMDGYAAEERARDLKETFTVDLPKRSHQWMLRNDLNGYVLLGDPAVRLPLRGNALAPAPERPVPALSAPAPTLAAPPAEGPPAPTAEVAMRERAVRALLAGDEAPNAIAARSGVPLPVLWAWFDAYGAGGRERLRD
jgi:hypothetical protein